MIGVLGKINTIAVLGAGHGGCAAVVDLVRRGFDVRLHARREQRLDELREFGAIAARGIHSGKVALPPLTTNVAEAIDGADLIMLTVPSVAHRYYAEALSGILPTDIPVFLNPGHTGGGLHFANELRQAGFRGQAMTCETVTLTYICRLEGPAEVGIYSYTKGLGFAAFPGKNAKKLFDLLKPVYPEIELRSSVLETALANMNAVFHPPGMIMNTGWIESTGGDFLFYKEGLTEGIGQVTSAIDDERMAVAKALDVPAQTFLESFYAAGLTSRAAADSGSIARACRESAPNATIKCPSSLDHRYVHEDIGYGLVPIAALGKLAGVATPTIDAMIHIAGTAVGIDYHRDGLTLERLGLENMTADDVLRYVHEGA